MPNTDGRFCFLVVERGALREFLLLEWVLRVGSRRSILLLVCEVGHGALLIIGCDPHNGLQKKFIIVSWQTASDDLMLLMYRCLCLHPRHLGIPPGAFALNIVWGKYSKEGRSPSNVGNKWGNPDPALAVSPGPAPSCLSLARPRSVRHHRISTGTGKMFSRSGGDRLPSGILCRALGHPVRVSANG